MNTHRVRDYLILKKIGEGGMGRVFLGEHVHLKQKVAVKMVHPHLAAQPHFLERFRREAQLQSSLQHPGIIAIQDFFLENGRAFMVSSFFPGKSLDQLLAERGPFSSKETIDLMLPVLEALNFAHGRGIIHHDIKPGNILVNREGRIKVTDFGLAQAGTQASENLGSPPYMSPERFQPGQTVDQTSDVYSAGVVMYELLTGSLPFEQEDAEALKQWHQRGVVPNPQSRNPVVDASLARVVCKALAKTPEERFFGCGELASYLRDVVRHSQNEQKGQNVSDPAKTDYWAQNAASVPKPEPKPVPSAQPRDKPAETQQEPPLRLLLNRIKTLKDPHYFLVAFLIAGLLSSRLTRRHAVFSFRALRRLMFEQIELQQFLMFHLFALLIGAAWLFRILPLPEKKHERASFLSTVLLPRMVAMGVATMVCTEGLWRLALPGWLKLLESFDLIHYLPGDTLWTAPTQTLLMLRLTYSVFLVVSGLTACWVAESVARFKRTPRNIHQPKS